MGSSSECLEGEKIEFLSSNYVNVPEMSGSGVSQLGDFTLLSTDHNQVKFLFADYQCTIDHELFSSQGGANQIYRIDMTCNGDRNDIKNQRGWMSISKNASPTIVRASSPTCAEATSEYHPHNNVSLTPPGARVANWELSYIFDFLELFNLQT